ncbi:uncharacterized protein LOC115621647 isoform X2 [Scaptodrosophila lebanonensis]|uniref:Uncharacterized protein LOC115621647 isoform X2 n=1 Tax=Drosophila lebanonensis TaxID=7225 RepID=A0A6J2T7U9_DROLE|nr:uncharacterized protein LOC115621647 isoform X2 [Scaptodrosophila lebanonensis]
MPPSIFFILFWRIAVSVLYPYGYTDCFIQDVLADSMQPNKRELLHRRWFLNIRDSFQTTLMLVMMMEAGCAQKTIREELPATRTRN